jgi:hypothetical protein
MSFLLHIGTYFLNLVEDMCDFISDAYFHVISFHNQMLDMSVSEFTVTVQCDFVTFYVMFFKDLLFS